MSDCKEPGQVEYIYSQRGHPLLVHKNFVYCKNRNRSWRCIQFMKERCKAHVLFVTPECVQFYGKHDHKDETERIIKGRIAFKAIQEQKQQQQQQQMEHILYPRHFQHINATINETPPQIKEENVEFID